MSRQKFIVDTASTFQTYIYEDGLKIVPTSATITVNKPNSEDDLITAQAMTVGGDGLLSYALTSGNNDTLDKNYQAVISYVVDAVTFEAVVYYDVVNHKLQYVITDDDLMKELPQISEQGYREYGTATSGSATTIVDLELQRFADNYFNGGLAVDLDNEEKREITNFVSSTGTVTTTTFSNAISTNKYMLVRSYTREIETAFDKIKSMIKMDGQNPEQFTDGDDLKLVHIYLSVAEVCKSFSTATESYWWDLWQKYETKGEKLFDSIEYKYDDNNDGIISSGEEGFSNRVRTTGRG